MGLSINYQRTAYMAKMLEQQRKQKEAEERKEKEVGGQVKNLQQNNKQAQSVDEKPEANKNNGGNTASEVGWVMIDGQMVAVSKAKPIEGLEQIVKENITRDFSIET